MFLHLIAPTKTGRRPFRHFNYWINCHGYKDIICKACAVQVSGYPQYQVVQKLKEVKKALKECRQTEAINTK